MDNNIIHFSQDTGFNGRDYLNKFVHGDALQVMRSIPDGSIDLVLTSPPYNIKNSTGGGFSKSQKGKWKNSALTNGYSTYNDNIPNEEYIKWQRECVFEMLRIIPNNGAIFYNHKWRVQGGILQDRKEILEGFPIRQIIIWQRSGGINFNDGYFLPTYEVIYLIAKPDFKLSEKANAHGDIWKFHQAKNNEHPAPFPVRLADRVIASTTAKNVLDPFMGSGTTALAAKNAEIGFVGIDVSLEYCEMASKRLRYPKSISKKSIDSDFSQAKLFYNY